MTYALNISPCPNDTFMFDAMVNGRIDCGGVQFATEYYDIEELNARAVQGIPQISKISAAVLPLVAGRYRVLDCGAALGRGNGPLLIRRRGERSPVMRVAVPGMHTTAAMLMQRLFPEITDVTPVLFSEIAEAVESGRFDAGVLIHEGRFVYERRNLELVADLGQLWEQRTGLPLPLGLIVVRRDLPEEVQTLIETTLRRSIGYALANPTASRDYVKSHARELDDEVIDKHIAMFVNDFSLSLGGEGRAAVEQMMRI